MGIKSVLHLIKEGVKSGASDLHLIAGSPPMYRVNGFLAPLSDKEALNAEETRVLSEELMNGGKKLDTLLATGQVDYACVFPGITRCRVNTFFQRGTWASAIRFIPAVVPALSSLSLPGVVEELAQRQKGLILVTGGSGSGKSTTLAGMIDFMNHSRNLNIITLEDPIEYMHDSGTCIIHQREVGTDTKSYSLGLRAVLRQDPDVILVGEIRDLDSVSITLTAAETGHLVLASLHSSTAAQAIERILGIFPPDQQAQVSMQLAASLQGIISQRLLPRFDGKGQVVAAEVLVATPAVCNLIRRNQIHQIDSIMQTGCDAGMVTMDKTLKKLYQQKLISLEQATIRQPF